VKIGIDATCWANRRGYGRFARELMAPMARLGAGDEFICLGDAASLRAWDGGLPNVRRVEVALDAPPATAASSTSNRSLRDLLRLSAAVRRERPDVVFFPTVYTYFPLPGGVPGIVTIHDTIPERFPHLTLPSLSARVFWTAKVRLAVQQCRLVLTVSDHAARSIAEVLGVSRDRLRVTTEAAAAEYRPTEDADHVAAAARTGIPPGVAWFAYVGGFNPHKRVDTILEAHADLASRVSPAPHLVLVGSRSDAFHGDARLERIIAEAGTGALVHWAGFVPDGDLAPLLGGAVALLLPSEAEGFGLPAVEAAACGTPVIATTESPLPELLDGAGYFVSPGDVAAITQAMESLLDPRQRASMSAVALDRTSRMSWENAAAATLSAIHEAAG
jgi:glycosyltransferase involved in cell wall biosynthesis